MADLYQWNFPGVKPGTAEYNRLMRAERKRMGICDRCKAPAVPGSVKCQKHIDEQRRIGAERYKRLRKESRCKCGEKIKPTQRTCHLCTIADRENQRRRRVRALERGMCVHCGKRQHRPGRVSCQVCVSRYNDWRRRVKLRRVRAAEFRRLYCSQPESVAARFEKLMRGGGGYGKRETPPQ